MIFTNILQGKKYEVVQTVSPISHDFLFLTIKLNCSDRIFFKKLYVEGSVSISTCAKFKNKFTEGDVRKFTVNFAFFCLC